jgi:hypothetical protein
MLLRTKPAMQRQLAGSSRRSRAGARSAGARQAKRHDIVGIESGRILDLSPRAADALEMKRIGVAAVLL